MCTPFCGQLFATMDNKSEPILMHYLVIAKLFLDFEPEAKASHRLLRSSFQLISFDVSVCK